MKTRVIVFFDVDHEDTHPLSEGHLKDCVSQMQWWGLYLTNLTVTFQTLSIPRIPQEDLVMRSIFLRATDDTFLRQLAQEHHVSKNELIRAAIVSKLEEWRNDPNALKRDLLLGVRN